jgi:hypothetical protein
MIIENKLNLLKENDFYTRVNAIWNISKSLYDINKKLLYIGYTTEFEDDKRFNRIFLESFFINSSIYDQRISYLDTFKHIVNISKYVDYIIIDDLDHIDTSLVDMLLETEKTILGGCKINRTYSDKYLEKMGIVYYPDDVFMIVKYMNRMNNLDLLLE